MYVACKKCKYNDIGMCVFYVSGGNEIDMPCYREKELKKAVDNFIQAFVETESDPKQKSGHWIDCGSIFKCSECGNCIEKVYGMKKFCDECGSYNKDIINTWNKE